MLQSSSKCCCIFQITISDFAHAFRNTIGKSDRKKKNQIQGSKYINVEYNEIPRFTSGQIDMVTTITICYGDLETTDEATQSRMLICTGRFGTFTTKTRQQFLNLIPYFYIQILYRHHKRRLSTSIWGIRRKISRSRSRTDHPVLRR